MNKTEFIAAMAKKAGMTKTDTKKALDAFMETTHEQLKKGNKITLIGFGTFDVVKRKARTAKNPQTGAAVKVPAKKVVKFKVGSKLGKLK
ncbi:MAG: HU family DNA-binding protein [Bacteroidales bacterium]|nr:HU family DNA-binding protein [Bacteroidales bacterium]